MTKSDLLKKAEQIKPLSEEMANEYSSKRNILVEQVNKKMIVRPDIEELVGENNIEMMKDNHANQARFMESIFYEFNPEVLVDTVLWVFRAYLSRNFSSTYWSALMNTFLEVYKDNLSENCYEAIYPYYNWMQINIPAFNSLAEKNIDSPRSSS
jgi:hypothetical protein